MESQDPHIKDAEAKMEREIAWLLREKYHGEKTEGFFTDCARLEAGEPLAYVIGHVPFLNATIYLDSNDGQANTRPLIPRPETEFWVENAIKEITASMSRLNLDIDAVLSRSNLDKIPHGIRVLDLCAGSGCIGVAVLKELPGCRVDFAEINARHHATILKNITENGVAENRSAIFGGDLFSEIPEGTHYDYILSNPPYIDPALASRTETSVTEFEPSEALWGGEKGLEIITRIITEAPTYLNENGILYIEHEPEQSDAIKTLAHTRGYADIESHKDQYGVVRTTRFRYH